MHALKLIVVGVQGGALLDFNYMGINVGEYIYDAMIRNPDNSSGVMIIKKESIEGKLTIQYVVL